MPLPILATSSPRLDAIIFYNTPLLPNMQLKPSFITARLPDDVLKRILTCYWQLFKRDRTAKLIPLLPSCRKIKTALMPIIYDEVTLTTDRQFTSFHLNASAKNLQLVRKLIVGPASLDDVLDRYGQGARTVPLPPDSKWVTRAKDIDVSEDGQPHKTNLVSLEANGLGHFAWDAVLAQVWKPDVWWIRARDLFEYRSTYPVPEFNNSILHAARTGIPIIGIDISILYYQWKQVSPDFEEMNLRETPLYDAFGCLAAEDWLNADGTTLMVTCERHPLALGYKTVKYGALRLHLVPDPHRVLSGPQTLDDSRFHRVLTLNMMMAVQHVRGEHAGWAGMDD